MCSISTRLDTLNYQLMIISKLQRMEEESYMYPHSMCKKYSMQNNFVKHCHCAYHILSLKEQCNRLNCTDECFLYDNSRKKSPCNARTCRARKKFHYCKGIQLSEVQTDLKNDLKVSKSAGVNVQSDTISQESVQKEGTQSRSDQVNLIPQVPRIYASDKMISTHVEQSEQTIPTKDTSHADLSVNTSNMTNAQLETAVNNERIQSRVDMNELAEVNYDTENVPVADKKMFERIQKDLSNERKRTEELEKKLKSLTCSLNCLKEDSEQKAACLRDALETAEEQTKFAMDLVQQSKNQSDLAIADRDELLNEITKLQQQIIEVAHANTALTQERDNLKNKLESLSDDESRRCEEVEKEVNRMKCAVKEKEDALNKERTEFMGMISELTNVIKIQKRRICEVTGICNNQQHILHEKDKELSQKSSELSEVQGTLESNNCVCQEMKEEIEDLKRCLCAETEACKCLQKDLEILQENHSSELRIKEKIVEEQNRTISRQRKLLNDSEEIAQQAASEFDQLKEELYEEKQVNRSLQITLDQTDKLNKACPLECEQCRILRTEIEYLKKEKQRALTIAKFAYQKFHASAKEYQKQLTCEKQQHMYMASIIETKEEEIGYLKRKVYQNSSRTIKKVNNYVA